MMCVIGILAQVSARVVSEAAVDHASVSFRLLQWWASWMPGDGLVRAYCGLAAFVLAVHVLQLPLLLRLHTASDRLARRRALLALAFTEIAPLAWAVANARAARLAFQVDPNTRYLPIGLMTAGFVPALFILPVFLQGMLGDGKPAPPLPSRRVMILFQTFVLGSFLACAIFGGLFGLAWISDVGGEVGLFMWMFGVLPLLAGVRLMLDRAPVGV